VGLSRCARENTRTFSSFGVDTPPPSQKASDANASQGLNTADPVLTPAVDTPAQDELIRNLVALVKEDPGASLLTLALKLDPHHRLGLGSEEVTALLKTDAVRRGLVEAGVSTPLVTSTSGRQQ